jgi:hypothetical protein
MPQKLEAGRGVLASFRTQRKQAFSNMGHVARVRVHKHLDTVRRILGQRVCKHVCGVL